MTWIKICGITNREDALKAVSLGIDAVGFIFAASPRRVNPLTVREIVQDLPPSVFKVGVFVNQDLSEVEKIAKDCNLNILQLHGEESSHYCRRSSFPVIKAIRVKGPESLKEMDLYPHVTLLLDTYHPAKAGGTGTPFPWEIAVEAKEKRDFILSGGLSPENVGEAIRKVRPLGVDISSGVESEPGKKDFSKMVDFVKEVKKADEKTR
jgi:phosphoribosylanthranilate isomerase